MKGFKSNLFLFIIIVWPIIVNSSIDGNDTHSAALGQHQGTTIQEFGGLDYLVPNINIINMTSDTVDYTQDFFYTQDLQKICHGQVNEFVWKCPTTSSDSEKKVLKFRTIEEIVYSSSTWYLKSINEIDIIKMGPKIDEPQIQFLIYKHKIYLSRVYPTYPEISGFEILQFITNLAFQCKFFIDVVDASDIYPIYSALYDKGYYEYHFKGVDLSQNFLFNRVKNIVVKKKTFLDCFEENMKLYLRIKTVGLFETLPKLFQKNILACENAFVPVEFCPITFNTHRIFYKESFQYCIDWSSIGGFPRIDPPVSIRFEITSEDITRIMNKKKQSNMNFIKINRDLDEKIIKTYDEIKTQIFTTSFLRELLSKIFQLCFLELEKIKSDPNPEDIFKLYLRPCVMPNINLFLKYYIEI